MLTFLLLATFINMTLLMASHPVMIMILVILQTLMVCLMTWLMSSTPWISFILFLIFIGGLMVLFIYITSLAANEKLTLPAKNNMNQSMILMYTLLTLGIFSYFYPMKFYPTHPLSNQVELIFNQTLTPITLIIMTYLLVTLIVAVKIAKKMEGPLRNTIKSK